MLQEALKVFDTSLYPDLEQEIRGQVISEDLAGLVLEAGNLSLENRINPRRFKIVGDNVVDSKTGENVLDNISYETDLARKESSAAIAFYRHLQQNPPGSLTVSLSPSGGPAGYKEGRVNAGYRLDEEIIEMYGIPTHLSPNLLVDYSARLAEWNKDDLSIQTAEDLREISIPIELPRGENPWEFLDHVAPLDSKAWKVILEGKPWIIKKAAETDAVPIAKEMAFRLTHAVTELDYIKIGAWGEKAMQKKGWELNAAGCPGLFNFQILTNNMFPLQYGAKAFTKDAFGIIRETKWEYHKGNCVNCSRKSIDVGPCSICKDCEKIL